MPSLVTITTMAGVAKVVLGADWIAVTEAPLPVAEVMEWVVRPDCGALVTFCGTVRDHSKGRTGVVSLEYEAYPEQVEPRLAAVASASRARWPAVDRLALLHRMGQLQVGDVSVVVAASTPHRVEAFEAARFCIDAVKQSVPIWKRETWADGSGWALCPLGLVDLDGADHAPRVDPPGRSRSGGVRRGRGGRSVRPS